MVAVVPIRPPRPIAMGMVAASAFGAGRLLLGKAVPIARMAAMNGDWQAWPAIVTPPAG